MGHGGEREFLCRWLAHTGHVEENGAEEISRLKSRKLAVNTFAVCGEEEDC